MDNVIPADLEEQLLSLIREKLIETGETMTVETDLFASGLDSMGIMQLMILIEERFGVRIAEAEVTRQNFGTAGDLSSLVRRTAGVA